LGRSTAAAAAACGVRPAAACRAACLPARPRQPTSVPEVFILLLHTHHCCCCYAALWLYCLCRS
jgi:hypothetical protein